MEMSVRLSGVENLAKSYLSHHMQPQSRTRDNLTSVRMNQEIVEVILAAGYASNTSMVEKE